MSAEENQIPEILFMPDPEIISSIARDSGCSRGFIKQFFDLEIGEDVEFITSSLDKIINEIKRYLPDEVSVIDCYKTAQQKMSDEYFYVKRNNENFSLRMILNATVIVRDFLSNNAADNYLDIKDVRLTFETIKNLLNYIVER